jgi:tripartite ATP-independent transporter DctM subunit
MIAPDLLSIFVLVLCFVSLLLLGVPISFSLGIATIATLLISLDPGIAVTTIAQRMAAGLDSFTLLAIPFFILAGQLMNRGGIARRLINFAKVLAAPYPGGLAYVNIVACMLFGAISGSAVAAAAAIGGLMIPLMQKEGYRRSFATAINITSSTTGLIIPPSNILIVYSLASGGVSVAALFLAGYIPGLLVGLSLILVSAVLALKQNYSRGERAGLGKGIKQFLLAVPSLFLLIVVVGGIVAGVFTATEASAVAVVYSFILAVLVYREVSWGELPQILLETSATTAMVMLLIATSMAMSWTMSFENIPQELTSALLSLTSSKFLLLILINLILLFVGTFMDMTPAVLIFTPILLPVATELGIDPTHFGIIMVLNLCIGLCTPPVGAVLFVGCGIAKVRISEVIRPMLPLYAAMLTALLLVTCVEEVSLFLPRLFGY